MRGVPPAYDLRVILSLLALAAPLVQDWTPPPAPATVPTLAMAQPRFAPFVLPDELRVVTSVPDLEPLARVLAEQLGQLLGRAVIHGEAPARSGDVVLTLGYIAEEVGEGPEALSIEVFEDHVALSGRTPAGVARAASRMLQLLAPVEGGGWVLPPFRLDDAPRFPWRAVRLRGLASQAEGERLLELLHLGSFNVLVVEAPPSEARAALARALRPIASALGIRLLLDPPPDGGGALPYARLGAGPIAEGTLPILITGAPAASSDAPALLAAGRTLIDGRSPALRLTGGDQGALAPALLYGWSPLDLLDGAGEGAASGSLILGAEVRLEGAAAMPAFERALPYLAERAWGAAGAPVELEAFEPRAERLRELVGAAGAASPASPASPEGR